MNFQIIPDWCNTMKSERMISHEEKKNLLKRKFDRWHEGFKQLFCKKKKNRFGFLLKKKKPFISILLESKFREESFCKKKKRN